MSTQKFDFHFVLNLLTNVKQHSVALWMVQLEKNICCQTFQSQGGTSFLQQTQQTFCRLQIDID